MEAIRLAPKYPGGPFSGRAFLVFPTVAAAEVRASLKPERHNPRRGGGVRFVETYPPVQQRGIIWPDTHRPSPPMPDSKSRCKPRDPPEWTPSALPSGAPACPQPFFRPRTPPPQLLIQRTFRFGIKFLHSWLIRGIFVFLILWDSVGFLIQAREV